MSGTRAEHLAWAKSRALVYADMGDAGQALASMGGDLQKHPETADHPATSMGMALVLIGADLRNPAEIRRWIEGYQ